jgi:phage I-like protein
MEIKLLAVLKEMIDGNVPNEFQVLPLGKIEIENEPPAHLDIVSIMKIIKEFDRRGNDMVIDYEHQTLSGNEAPAAGWIKQLINKGAEGIWATVDWTDKAKTYLQNREYRYFSPVFWVDKYRKVAKIENVALTNYPRLNNLKPIMAKYSLENPTEEEIMLEKLKKLLGLADDAGEDKAVEAVTLLVNRNKELEGQGKVVACKEVLEALGAKTEASAADLIQIVAGLKAPADAAVQLSQEVARLKTEMAEIKQVDLVQMALKEGKTSPDELDKWGRDLALKSPEQFKLIVLSRPAGSVIPIDRIPDSPPEKKGAMLDETQLSINKMMGVTDELFIKYANA